MQSGVQTSRSYGLSLWLPFCLKALQYMWANIRMSVRQLIKGAFVNILLWDCNEMYKLCIWYMMQRVPNIPYQLEMVCVDRRSDGKGRTNSIRASTRAKGFQHVVWIAAELFQEHEQTVEKLYRSESRGKLICERFGCLKANRKIK